MSIRWQLLWVLLVNETPIICVSEEKENATCYYSYDPGCVTLMKWRPNIIKIARRLLCETKGYKRIYFWSLK